MRLSLPSWKRTLGALGYKVVRKSVAQKAQQNRNHLKLNQQPDYGTLEPRQMMAGDTGLVVQAELDDLFTTISDPIVVKLGQFDANDSQDAAILSSDGQLTIATNGNDNSWQNQRTVDLGVGELHGLELALVDDDPFADLILQGDNNLFVALNDGEGNFSIAQTLAAPSIGAFNNGTLQSLPIETGDFNGDLIFDVAAFAPELGQLVVYLGVSDGSFAAPITQSTGAAQSTEDTSATALVSGDFVGNGYPDFALGHADGAITFLENTDGENFVLRPELTQRGFDTINDLATADLAGDGDTDIVVSSGDSVTILENRSETFSGPTVTNGGFGQGLSAWNVEIVGQRNEAVAGSVIAQSGFAQLVENESFLVSINQAISIPDDPQLLQVDLLSLGLEDPNGGVPDAFEISILDEDGNSLVPTFRPEATSFFNVNPGVDGADPEVNLAPGVTFDGTTVSLDLSGVAVGTTAIVYFDLIGNGPGNGSTVTIDNVRVTPEIEFETEFDRQILSGPFGDADQLVVADLDGDNRLDIAVTDAASDEVVVFNGQQDGTFERTTIALASPATGLVSIDAAPLTAGDSVSDLVVLGNTSETLISPLSSDQVAPAAILQSPIAGQTNTGSVSQIDIRFDEAIRNVGDQDSASVTFVDNYTVTFLGADATAGTADDQEVSVTGISYDSNTNVASLTIDPAAAPLADGVYTVSLNSSAIQDLAGNLLADGQPVEFQFTLNSVGPVIAPIAPLSGVEGDTISLAATFTDAGGATPYTAQIDWGDGTTTELDLAEFNNGSGLISANHIFADNGDYNVMITLQDANGVTTQAFTSIQIANADPIVVADPNVLQTVVRGQQNTFELVDFTDAGVNSLNIDAVESFTASIDWGDGTTSTGVVTSTTALPGNPSTGSVTGDHTFTVAGAFTVTVTVTDDDGGSDSVSFEVLVESDVPVVSAIPPITGAEGSEISLSSSFTDNGGNGIYQATINWGDGTTTSATVNYDPTTGIGLIDANHVYADNGDYDISVELVDPDSNTVTQTTTASIDNIAPTLVVGPDRSVVAGEAINFLLADFSDPGFSSAIAGTTESFLATIDWGDGTTQEVTVTVENGSVGVLTTGGVAATHTYALAGSFVIGLTVADDDGGTATAILNVSVTDPAGGDVRLPNIDFDTRADGSATVTGEIIAEQFADWGVHITTHDPIANPPLIFNSANPSGGDTDLATSTENNILIISEDADTSDPDDRAAGGTLIFTFDNPVVLDRINLLDIDGGETATIRLFDADGNSIQQQVINGSGNGQAFSVDLSAVGVSSMEVEFSASGAITELIFCENGVHNQAPISGAATVIEGETYNLELDFDSIPTTSSLDRWEINWGDGSFETVTDSFASHVFADGLGETTILATAYATDGSIYRSQPLSVDIVRDLPTLTINGGVNVDVGETYTLALDSTDPDSIQGWLIDWGDGTGFQTVIGNPDAVTHVYASQGQFTIQARAFEEAIQSGDTITENNGLIVFEAEQFDSQVSGTGNGANDQWEIVNDSSAAGGQFILGGSNDNGFNAGDSTQGARADYEVNFTSTGTWYAWVLIQAPSSGSNSVHLGLDGEPTTYGGIGLDVPAGDWTWTNEVQGRPQRVTIDVATAGDHTVNLWIREDGVRVDRILLTQDADFIPSETGPNATTADPFATELVSNQISVNVEAPATRFFTVDRDNDRIYQYDQAGNPVGDFDGVQTSTSRGITTNADGSIVWVLKSNENVYVYDGQTNELLGSWDAVQLNAARGIANSGSDLWIVDALSLIHI